MTMRRISSRFSTRIVSPLTNLLANLPYHRRQQQPQALRGSDRRDLQVGTATGTSTINGSASGVGGTTIAENSVNFPGASAGATGTIGGSGGSSGFVDTSYGEVEGTSSAIMTASTVGSAKQTTTVVIDSDILPDEFNFSGTAGSTAGGAFAGTFEALEDTEGIATSTGTFDVNNQADGSILIMKTAEIKALGETSTVGAATNSGGAQVSSSSGTKSVDALASGASAGTLTESINFGIDTDPAEPNTPITFDSTAATNGGFGTSAQGSAGSGGGTTSGNSVNTANVLQTFTSVSGAGFDPTVLVLENGGTGTSNSGSSSSATAPTGEASGSNAGTAAAVTTVSGFPTFTPLLLAPFNGFFTGELKDTGTASSSGNSNFISAFSPSFAGVTGGIAGGNGELGVSGNSNAASNGGGEASASNILGSAGGQASGGGTAVSTNTLDLTVVFEPVGLVASFEDTGAATAFFNNVGSGQFGGN
jgi:hypothetical protein